MRVKISVLFPLSSAERSKFTKLIVRTILKIFWYNAFSLSAGKKTNLWHFKRLCLLHLKVWRFRKDRKNNGKKRLAQKNTVGTKYIQTKLYKFWVSCQTHMRSYLAETLWFLYWSILIFFSYRKSIYPVAESTV